MQKSQNLLKARFDKASLTYEKVADIQKQSAKFLVDRVPQLDFKSVLDLGAGTGYVTRFLMGDHPNAFYSLNDLSPNMLAAARDHLGPAIKAQLICGNMEQIDFDFHDLVISNLAVQWAQDLSGFIHKIWPKSGVLAFSTLLEGSFADWEKLFQEKGLPLPTHDYPSEGDMKKILDGLPDASYRSYVKEFTQEFADARSVMIYLKELGASKARHTITTQDLKKLIATCDKPLSINYRVFFAVII